MPDHIDLERRFNHHPPRNSDIVALHERWRAACKDLAEVATEIMPVGRERSLALTHIEVAMFWGNAAIAREGK